MKIIRNPKTEPEWDTVGISCTDFRPHFNGDLVNLYSVVFPAETRAATEQFLVASVREIARWVLAHRDKFGPEDRFQIILGWPKSLRETDRQIVKMGGDYDVLAALADETAPVALRPGWDEGVFDRRA